MAIRGSRSIVTVLVCTPLSATQIQCHSLTLHHSTHNEQFFPVTFSNKTAYCDHCTVKNSEILVTRTGNEIVNKSCQLTAAESENWAD